MSPLELPSEIQTFQRELDQVKRGAERLARGELDSPIEVPASDEIGSVARSLNQMAEQLRRLEAIRREFVSNVSHELKTPLTAIKGFVETLLDGAIEDREQAREFLTIISRHVERMIGIIVDLLTLSQLEERPDGEQIPFEEQPLRDVIACAAQLCEHSAREKAIVLTVQCQENIRCRINASLLEQALINLVENAIKYSDSAAGVDLVVEDADDMTVIHVRDYGQGIPPEHLDRIFNRFYRVDKARTRKLGGTGLGLSIVKHIAQAHGGWAKVASEVGKGSTFSIYLPRHARQAVVGE